MCLIKHTELGITSSILWPGSFYLARSSQPNKKEIEGMGLELHLCNYIRNILDLYSNTFILVPLSCAVCVRIKIKYLYNHDILPMLKINMTRLVDNAKCGIPSQGGGGKLTLIFDRMTQNQSGSLSLIMKSHHKNRIEKYDKQWYIA